MPEISAIITVFRLKRNHAVYCSINNNFLFSALWVFLTISYSFHTDYREEKGREKTPHLFRKEVSESTFKDYLSTCHKFNFISSHNSK